MGWPQGYGEDLWGVCHSRVKSSRDNPGCFDRLKVWWKEPRGRGRKPPALRFAELLCTLGGASVIAGYALTIPAIPALLCFIIGDKLQALGTRLYDSVKTFDGARFK